MTQQALSYVDAVIISPTCADFIPSRIWEGLPATWGWSWRSTTHCPVWSHHNAGQDFLGEIFLSTLQNTNHENETKLSIHLFISFYLKFSVKKKKTLLLFQVYLIIEISLFQDDFHTFFLSIQKQISLLLLPKRTLKICAPLLSPAK